MREIQTMKKYGLTTTIDRCRQGWAGVWDAIVFAATGRPLRTVARPVRITVWASEGVTIEAVQLDEGTPCEPY
jgi:hypothetical protein